MKIFVVHNSYKLDGGEDSVKKNEVALLRNNGKCVECLSVSNELIDSVFRKIIATFSSIFSLSSYLSNYFRIIRARPNVVHVHNYFPLVSPAIFYACSAAGVPVVHTLHNYRAICPTALLMHEGKIEERSVKGSSWWAVYRRVYRDSWVGTLALAVMIEIHKRGGTWKRKVDRFIALTEFSRKKYIEAGWPEDKIVVKPNFTEDPYGGSEIVAKRGGYGIFVGRLSSEKGINLLLDAWRNIDLRLKVAGRGELVSYVQRQASRNIEYVGSKMKSEVLDLVQHADFIVMASTWYEGFPMVLVEAFSCGTPALVPRLGSMEEIVRDGITGLHFEAGNADDLNKKAQWMIDHPAEARKMGENARREYLNKYTPEQNYEMLMDIYQEAIEESRNH